jgi:diguanylate cyclase (GGDEF)-like protein
MTPDRFSAIVGFAGVAAELGGALMLAALFYFLRRQVHRRRYLAAWAWAWLALTLGIGALVVRYLGLVAVPPWSTDEFSWHVRASYFVYQFFKLQFLALLVGGALLYARGTLREPRLVRSMLAAGAYAAVSVGLARNLSDVVTLQAPLAAAAFGAAGWVLLRLRGSRRSLASAATSLFFFVLAGLWVMYLFAFGLFERLAWTAVGPVLSFVLRFNSYLDLLLHMLLGYGMVLLLMEDRKREVDDVYAELAVAHDALRRSSLYDPLTGALNRRAFIESVGLETAQAGVGAVVMVDLDNLKEVNDAYGHAAGDELLRKTAEALRGALRTADKLYRWGGDEFLLVLPDALPDDVRRRYAALMADAPPVVVSDGGPPIPIQVSVGAADFRGAEGLAGAIERADRAMYAEKERHRLVRSAAGFKSA